MEVHPQLGIIRNKDGNVIIVRFIISIECSNVFEILKSIISIIMDNYSNGDLGFSSSSSPQLFSSVLPKMVSATCS